jgi:hypothetical protein
MIEIVSRLMKGKKNGIEIKNSLNFNYILVIQGSLLCSWLMYV